MTDTLEGIKAKWNIEPFISGSTLPWGKDDVVWLVSEVDRTRKQLAALRWQVEHEGCAASHLGETTYECRADAPCGLCRLRAERDALRAKVDSLKVYAPTFTYEGTAPTNIIMDKP